MKKLRSILLLILFVIASFFSTQVADLGPRDASGVRVKRAVDGDTLVVEGDEEMRVRLVGIDTPETVHPNGIVEPWGKEASNFTKKSLEGKVVYLEYDEEEEDHYGRKLAYVWTEDPEASEKPKEDILFNAALVRGGYARERAYPPNTKYQKMLKRAEDEAIDANRGLWAIEGDEGPAKGNKNSGIYHMPGDQQYNRISDKNVVLFDTAKEAEKAGYQRAFSR